MGDYDLRIFEALEAVKNGQSLRSAASDWGIAPSTLSRRLYGTQSRQQGAVRLQRLTPEQEMILSDWILAEEVSGRAPTKKFVRGFAQEILNIEGEAEPLGKRWVDSFLDRHPELQTKVGRVIDGARIYSSKNEAIREFYDRLAAVRKKYDIRPEHEYNMDEAGAQEGEGEGSKVIGTSRTRRARLARGEGTDWVTFIEYICLDGTVGSPVIIFSGKNPQAQHFPRNNVPEWSYAYTKKGWSNNVIANRWLEEIFFPETKPSDDSWRLLIIDGHNTHVFPEFMFKCWIQKVYILYLAAHASDDLQPLDVGVFSPLKHYYHEYLNRFATHKATAPIYKRRMLEAYAYAREMAFTPRNIKAGWRYAGLSPFNPAIGPSNQTASQAPIDKGPLPDTPPLEPAEVVVTTPRKAKDLHDQSRAVAAAEGDLTRGQRLLVNKASKSIALLAGELARERAKNAHLEAEIQKHEPDKRQDIEKNPNHVFANLREIREAQDKREKRIRPTFSDIQLEMDTFVEHNPRSKKRSKRQQK